VLIPKKKKIAFASKCTSTTEAKYKPFLLDFAASKFTLDKFSDIIWGFPVEIKTDCQALCDTLLSEKLSTVHAWWRDGILAHQIVEVCHVPGNINVVADGLSWQWEGQPVTSNLEDGGEWTVSPDRDDQVGLVNDILLTPEEATGEQVKALRECLKGEHLFIEVIDAILGQDSMRMVWDKPSWLLTTIIVDFPTMSSNPSSPEYGQSLLASLAQRASRPPVALSGDPSPTPSVAPPLISHNRQDETGNNSQDFLAMVSTGTPISQLLTPPLLANTTTTLLVPNGEQDAGGVGMTPKGKAGKPPPRRALSVNEELSVFDIHNIFCHRWFLSRDHLMTQVILAQKAKDGKIFWVEFTPQFHAHLVKCAIALVPCPLQKVKKVMFGYILELLNEEGPKAFFNLTKGQQRATQAQKEKKQIACKRNRTSRWEHWKAAEEAAEGRTHWQCQQCGRKFTSRKAEKRHRCPLTKEASGKSGEGKGKGKAVTTPELNKPAPKTRTTPPIPKFATTATRLLPKRTW
jgi:RNase H-like domain found in reverse transcriptase